MQPKIRIIAEAGVNHNGSEAMAMELIDVAVNAGADIVKFQTFKAENLASSSAAKATYQCHESDVAENQLDMLKRLELDWPMHYRLQKYCDSAGIEFMSTPFDHESLKFLTEDLKLKRLKISSGDLTNAPLLLDFSRTGCELILSTGMATLAEVERALTVLAWGGENHNGYPSAGDFQRCWSNPVCRDQLRQRLTILHCTSQYPAPINEINLQVMSTLAQSFSMPVGYSDHTEGIAIATAAAAMGACIIEKHFTLDRNLPGPDHKASLEPDELSAMVLSIRQVEKAIGSSIKTPQISELNTLKVARKSLVAACPIAKGELFSENNLSVKRPSSGRSPFDYWSLIGTPAPKDYIDDEVLL